MLRITSFTCSSAILQLLINVVDEDEVTKNESTGNEINLSNHLRPKSLLERII